MISKIATRAVYVIISLFLAKLTFDYLYHNFLAILPDSETFEEYKNVYTPEFNAFRKQYSDAYERSIIYSVAAFIVTIIIFEYINATLLIKSIYNNISKDIKDIRELNR